MSFRRSHSAGQRVRWTLLSLSLLALPVRAQVPAAFSISPSSVTGGTSVTGTIRLPVIARASMTFQLSSNNPAAQVPATTTVPVGSTSVRFTISTSPVAANTTIQIRATAGDVQATDTFVIVPPGVSSLTLSSAQAFGGSSVPGTVRLTGPVAANQSVRVPLTNTFVSSVNVPSHVVVASGQSTATFNVGTSPVSAADTGTVVAGEGAGAKSAALTINPPVVLSVTATPTTGNVIVGGSASNGARVEVRFTGDVPPGFKYSLEADSPLVTFSSSVGSPSRGDRETVGPFIKPVSSEKTVTVTATTSGVSKSASFTVVPPTPALLICNGRTAIPPTVGSNPVKACVLRLNGQAPDGFNVALTSSGPGSVPGNVGWTAGREDSAQFSIDTTPVSEPKPLSITASGKTFALSVIPPGVANIVLNPPSVLGGGEVRATVLLSGDAPTGGITLPIGSGNVFAADMPPNVTISAGQTTATFRIGTVPVQVDTPVTVTVGVVGASKTVTLFVLKPTS